MNYDFFYILENVIFEDVLRFNFGLDVSAEIVLSFLLLKAEKQ